MRHAFTRDKLHGMVWSDPISKIASRFEMSDVALSKVCKKHGIPKPPRGYWAKLQSGKTADRPKLPSRALGMPEYIEIRKGYWPAIGSSDPTAIVVPPEYVFEETLEELLQRVVRLVDRTPISTSMDRAHRSVARLLEWDSERREKQKDSSYKSMFDDVLFETPYERRRLRLVNAIFMGLSKAGMSGNARGKDPKEFDVLIGEQHVSFTLDSPGVPRNGWRNDNDLKRRSADSMTLQIAVWPETRDLQVEWSDESERRLEKRVPEIIATLIVAGELQYRLWVVAHREHVIQRRQYLIDESLRVAEEERERVREEKHQRDQTRIDKLLQDAQDLERAHQIRRYVQAVNEANQVLVEPLSAEDMQKWSDWALRQADRIDPVRSRVFLNTGDDLEGSAK